MIEQRSLSIHGLIQASIVTVLAAFYNVYLKTVIELYDVVPIVFACVCLISCAFTMMLIAGPGRLAKETLFSSATWLYGFILIALYLIDIFLMTYMSGTEASLFNRVTSPLAGIMAFILFKRKQGCGHNIGNAVIVVGLIWLVWLQPASALLSILTISVFLAILDLAQLFITEIHRESNIAHEHGNLRDKTRVVGFVTFITSLTLFCCVFALSLTKEYLPESTALNVMPSIASFFHAPTVISAMLLGMLILPLQRYCKWSSTYNLKTENVFIFLTFVPALTFVLELLAENIIPGFNFNTQAFSGERGMSLLGITLLVTLGGLISGFYELKKSKVDLSNLADLKKQLLRGEDRALASGYQPTARDDYEAVTTTLEQCGNDTKLAARLLDVPPGALEAVLASAGRQAFHPTVAARVARNFRHNVALADPLTGLHNRLSFMNALRQLLTSKKPLALLFIDLNKFKPVNDTYGHEAGDAVLKTIGQRLQNAAPQGSLVARLGGDEFVVTLSGGAIKNATQLTQDILAAIQEPILLTSDLPPVELDAAIGKAHYPLDAKTAEDLIKQADKLMYKNKGKR